MSSYTVHFTLFLILKKDVGEDNAKFIIYSFTCLIFWEPKESNLIKLWQEGHKVSLNVYDLSQGLARQLSMTFLGKAIEGIW